VRVDVGGVGGTAPSATIRSKMPAGPALVAEDLGLLGHRFAQAAQQHRAAFEADQRVVLADLEGGARWSVTSERRPSASTCSGRSLSLENRPLVKAWKLATPRPSERVKVWPVAGSTYFQSGPAPASSSTLTKVRSTMARARTAGHVAQQALEFGLAVDAAGLEVAPAAVERDVQLGVALAGDVGHFGAAASRSAPSSTVNQADSPARARQQLAAALAHRDRGAQEAAARSPWERSRTKSVPSVISPRPLVCFSARRRARRRA
jgi:hypothetical protein